MLKLVEKNYYKINCIFMLILAVYCMCGLILPLQFITANKIVTSLMTLLGLLIAMYNLFVKKVYKNVQNIKYLFLFLGVNIVTCAIVIKYGYMTNIKNMIVFIIYFISIYPVFSLYGKELSKKLYNMFLYVIVAFNTVGVLVSLLQFLLLKGYKSENYKGRWVRQGFIESRLFGIFSDPNYLSITSLITIIFLTIGIGTLVKKQNIIRWTAVALNYFYIVLSGSRTTFICLVVVSLVYSLIKFLDGKDLKKSAIKIFASIILVVVSYKAVAFTGEQYLKLNVTKVQEEKKEHEQKYSLERTDTSEENISNNRFTIWQSTARLAVKKPILGYSSGNWYEVAKTKDPNEYVVKEHYYTHNGYLEMFFYNGLIGLAIMGIFVFSFVKELFMKFKNGTYNNQIVLLSLITIVILVSNMFLSSTFYGINLLGIILFMNIGYYFGVLHKSK